jgi:transposase
MPEILSGSTFLPDSTLLTLKNLKRRGPRWTLEADGPDHAACPGCRKVSAARHSSYWRTLRDLPTQGVTVTLKVRVGRWKCRNARCQTKFFSTELPGVSSPYSRQTSRAQAVALAVGHALGGRPAERLLRQLGLPMSDDTILRSLKQNARGDATAAVARVVGIDDWAQRKGQSYGTIVVDLKRRRVVDLLAERSTEAVAQWLAKHPKVRTIARDRNGRYARAARRSAPQATQVADRFHLAQNLRETVQRELAVQRRHLSVSLPPAPPVTMVAPLPAQAKNQRNRSMRTPSEVAVRDDEEVRQRRQQKLELFRMIQTRKAEGLKVSQIARQLGMNRRRIDKWVKLKELPERSKMQPRPGMAESFREYLRQRWDAGYQHGRTLLAEIRELGYTGSYSWLAHLLSPWRREREREAAEGATIPSLVIAAEAQPESAIAVRNTPRQISPQVAAALLSKPKRELTSRQAEIVDSLKRDCPGFAVMRTLVLSFRGILQNGKVSTLHRWMERAWASGIQSLRRFAQKLKQDLRAVEAAVRSKWSSGPVEGHVNRLKMLKRQMYGQASVELLRARVMPLALHTCQQQK